MIKCIRKCGERRDVGTTHGFVTQTEGRNLSEKVTARSSISAIPNGIFSNVFQE